MAGHGLPFAVRPGRRSSLYVPHQAIRKTKSVSGAIASKRDTGRHLHAGATPRNNSALENVAALPWTRHDCYNFGCRKARCKRKSLSGKPQPPWVDIALRHFPPRSPRAEEVHSPADRRRRQRRTDPHRRPGDARGRPPPRSLNRGPPAPRARSAARPPHGQTAVPRADLVRSASHRTGHRDRSRGRGDRRPCALVGRRRPVPLRRQAGQPGFGQLLCVVGDRPLGLQHSGERTGNIRRTPGPDVHLLPARARSEHRHIPVRHARHSRASGRGRPFALLAGRLRLHHPAHQQPAGQRRALEAIGSRRAAHGHRVSQRMSRAPSTTANPSSSPSRTTTASGGSTPSRRTPTPTTRPRPT